MPNVNAKKENFKDTWNTDEKKMELTIFLFAHLKKKKKIHVNIKLLWLLRIVLALCQNLFPLIKLAKKKQN